jgi:hypothetical protein
MNKNIAVVPAEKLKGIISIPAEFQHKDVEVRISLSQKKRLDPRRYRGAGKST